MSEEISDLLHSHHLETAVSPPATRQAALRQGRELAAQLAGSDPEVDQLASDTAKVASWQVAPAFTRSARQVIALILRRGESPPVIGMLEREQALALADHLTAAARLRPVGAAYVNDILDELLREVD